MIKLEDFRNKLKIDKYLLDDELVNQPSLLCDITDAYAEAIAIRDTLKEALKTTDANLDAEVRKRKDIKVTDKVAENLVQAHEDHAKAAKAYGEAKLQADKINAVKEAVVDRGFALKTLAELAMANYYERNSIKDTSVTNELKYNRARQRLADIRKGSG